MKAKAVILRERARQDIDEALSFYLSEGATTAAEGFIDALERAMGQIARQPGMGSPRYAHELQIPGLRCWATSRFPYLIFYVEHTDHLDVWRVLHGQRDVPAWLHGDEGA